MVNVCKTKKNKYFGTEITVIQVYDGCSQKEIRVQKKENGRRFSTLNMESGKY